MKKLIFIIFLFFIFVVTPLFAQQWTECLDLTGLTCDQICANRGMVCSSKCTTSRGYENWGAEAWGAGTNCEGQGAGQTGCDFVGDGVSPGVSGVRWKCCCELTLSDSTKAAIGYLLKNKTPSSNKLTENKQDDSHK